ncbi:MAG: hypothetical protein V4501_08570 [Pseudomonadota bacterium]
MTTSRAPAVGKTLQEIENDNQHQSNSRGVAFAAAAAFFGMFITARSVPLFLGQLASKIILPITAGSSAVDLFYKWQAHQKKKQLNGNASGFATLMVDTAVNLGVITSVITAFAINVAVAPIIAVASLALKSAWELAMAAKDFYQAVRMPGVDETSAAATNGRRSELYRKAFVHLAQGLVTGLIGLSLGLMAWSGLAAFTYLGLAAAGTGAVLEARTKEENGNLGQMTLTDAQEPASNASTSEIALKLGHGFEHAKTIVNSKHYDAVMAPPAPTPKVEAVAIAHPSHDTPDYIYTPSKMRA